jgi:flavin-dependent dehydrogenase
MYIKPSPPDGTRGGILIPLEGDRWHVSLVGIAGDYPPIDEEGFLAFARSLPASQLYEAIQEAEPLAKPYGYRRTDSRVRHYDQLPSYLEGFLVSGDAAYTLNPLYVQGMTTAALGSLALDASLKAQRQQAVGDLTGLAGTFQRKLSQALAETWRMVTSHDLRWPATQIIETPDYYSLPAAKLTFKPGPVSYRPAYAQ